MTVRPGVLLDHVDAHPGHRLIVNSQPTWGPISRNDRPLAFSRSASCRCSTVRCGRIRNLPQLTENPLDSLRLLR